MREARFGGVHLKERSGSNTSREAASRDHAQTGQDLRMRNSAKGEISAGVITLVTLTLPNLCIRVHFPDDDPEAGGPL